VARTEVTGNCNGITTYVDTSLAICFHCRGRRKDTVYIFLIYLAKAIHIKKIVQLPKHFKTLLLLTGIELYMLYLNK